MLYYSLNKQSPKVDFKEATIRGQAPDKGLYFPAYIPILPKDFIKDIVTYSKEEIALQVIQPYVGDTIAPKYLQQIVEETINFDFPLVKVDESKYALELFHGPTLAFKDVGARFMSRCLGYFAKEEKEKVIVLVATSGDTGGAVANGFYNVEGVEVVILYPSGKVSSVQEKQLTTLGNNIHALEIDANFDDCQQLVKHAFSDNEINKTVFLTSANSINVARWLPQQFYYFFGYRKWEHDEPPVVSVPSGNFGNICAGILAHISGLPVKRFIAACNANDVIPDYIRRGVYEAKKAVSTLSNAMDVGNPSNFVRILEIFDNELGSLKNVLTSYSVSDDETKNTIKQVYDQYAYVLDPHGAVAYNGLQKYLLEFPKDKGIFLETAHPVKFPGCVEDVLDLTLDIPESIAPMMQLKKTATIMPPDYVLLKDFLLKL
jgi:threonine synthase